MKKKKTALEEITEGKAKERKRRVDYYAMCLTEDPGVVANVLVDLEDRLQAPQQVFDVKTSRWVPSATAYRATPAFDKDGIPSPCSVCGKQYCDHPWVEG